MKKDSKDHFVRFIGRFCSSDITSELQPRPEEGKKRGEVELQHLCGSFNTYYYKGDLSPNQGPAKRTDRATLCGASAASSLLDEFWLGITTGFGPLVGFSQGWPGALSRPAEPLSAPELPHISLKMGLKQPQDAPHPSRGPGSSSRGCPLLDPTD